jgi:hypothetical protein
MTRKLAMLGKCVAYASLATVVVYLFYSDRSLSAELLAARSLVNATMVYCNESARRWFQNQFCLCTHK